MNLNPFEKYPIDVTIFEKRHGNLIRKKDKARRLIEEDEHERYDLKNEKKKIMPPDYESIVQSADGNSCVYLYKGNSNQYMFFKPEFDKDKIEANVIPDKRERLNWLIQEKERIGDKWTVMSWIAENKELILIIGTGLALGIMFFGAARLMGQLVPHIQKLNQQIPQLTKALQGMTPK